MKRALLAVFAAFCLPAAAWGAGAPPVSGAAYIVERGSGEVLAQQNADARLPVASITKLMNVHVTLQSTKLSDVVTVPAEATAVDGSTAGLRTGERLTVKQLLEAALVPSANDAADALAYHVGHGSQALFVSRMNAKARALHLRRTHFVRPEGLDRGDVSSARDVTRLARFLMLRPEFRAIVRERSVTVNGLTFASRNNLLSTYPAAIGVKTGHTDAAGWCEVAAARRNGVTVYATILGAPSESQRDADLTALLDWGLSRYRPAVIAAPNRTYGQVETGFGRGSVALVAARRVVRPVRVGRRLVERVVAPSTASLPVRRGRPLGRVEVYQGHRLVGSSPLVAARSVSRPSLPGRVGWYVARTFENLFTGL